MHTLTHLIGKEFERVQILDLIHRGVLVFLEAQPALRPGTNPSCMCMYVCMCNTNPSWWLSYIVSRILRVKGDIMHYLKGCTCAFSHFISQRASWQVPTHTDACLSVYIQAYHASYLMWYMLHTHAWINYTYHIWCDTCYIHMHESSTCIVCDVLHGTYTCMNQRDIAHIPQDAALLSQLYVTW